MEAEYKPVPEFPDSSIKLSIASTPAHLPVVRSAVESVCKLVGFDESTRGEIVLAVDEALANVIKHAYQGSNDKPIEIILRSVGGDKTTLQIELRDWGRQVAPAAMKSRDLDDVRPGGLGVHIMERCMDEVKYTHAPDGGTLLTLIKIL
ncbi:MAG: ATP-binding protein [Planctomycetota bacterium]|nr:ATP-binding protein [Planctomycetota bacterium]